MDTVEATRPDRWLSSFARDVTSQWGEDGILEKVLETIGDRDRWCVEFGAADGGALSNTAALIDAQGYSAVLIEASPSKYRDLVALRGSNPRVVTVRTFVGYEGEDRLDPLLARAAPALPRDFDLLSIDIDGNDYHVWEAVERYRPKVVIIEHNPSMPNAVEFVQPRDPGCNHGSSLRSIVGLAGRKGYELVAVTDTNGIFVDRRYFARFGIRDNSLAALRPDEKYVTYLLSGYDGRIFVRGYGILPWHGLRYLERSVQQLPWFLRRYPGDYRRFQHRALQIYRGVRHFLGG
jgi:hypothetical protein